MGLGQLSEDGYARLPYDEARSMPAMLHGGTLTFFDVDRATENWDHVLSYLQHIPPTMLTRTPTVLFRWPEAAERSDDVIVQALGATAEVLEARRLRPRVGFAIFTVGAAPRIEWHLGRSVDDEADLERARRAELAAFLTWGNAIWQPASYHYVLPSGHHAETFIRIGEALRGDPSAAGSLATWLYDGFDADLPTTCVVDTGTLSPIVTELRAAAGRAGLPVGRDLSIDAYPVSRYEYLRTLRLAEGSWVLGLQSVNSSGGLNARMESALRQTVGEDYRLETLVSRAEGPRATGVPIHPGASGVQAPWLSIDDRLDPPIPPGLEISCDACRDQRKARLVRIDPQSMSAMALPAPVRIVPAISDGRRNRELWEAYDGCPQARVGGDVEAQVAVSLLGPTNTRGRTVTLDGDKDLVFFEPALLLQSGALDRSKLLTRRIKTLKSPTPGLWSKDAAANIAQAVEDCTGEPIHIAIFDQEEHDLLDEHDRSSIFADLIDVAGGGTPVIVTHRADDGGGFRPVVETDEVPSEPARVVVFAFGVRTGVTLQRMFLDARDRWADASIAGIVLHAHPSDRRYWDGIRNTFKDDSGHSQLLALWLTHLPRRAPLHEEMRLLQSLPLAEIPERLQPLYQQRERGHDHYPFWGPRDGVTVRPTSYFGDRLSAQGVFIALGSAVHLERMTRRQAGTPDWTVFDLPRVFRSYFDGIIQAAVLRWLEPAECWWGDRPDDAVHLLQELQHRTQSLPDWKTLLPELLLAAAQSKMPEEAAEHILQVAEEQLDQFEPDERLWVELGILVCSENLRI